MLAYTLKRILAMVPTLLGITVITFVIINFAPGDPVATSMGAGGATSTDSGGSRDQDRLADAIKAKKRLLGMMREDYALQAYAPSGASAPAPDASVAALARADHGELPAWAHALAVGPSGWLVVGGDRGMLEARDAAGAVARAWKANEAVSVWALSIAGDTLVAGGGDGSLAIYDVAGSEPRKVLPGGGRPIRGVAVLPDGGFLAISDEGWVRRFSADGQKLQDYVGHLSGATALALAADGASFWTGGRDRTLRRWDIASGTQLASVEGHEQAIGDIAPSPDGARLATACDDRIVRVFPVAADGTLGDPVVLAGHTKAATAVAWVGGRLFSGSRDETVREWDPAASAQVAQVPAAIGAVHDLAAAPDGGSVYVAADAWRVVPVLVRYVRWLGRLALLDFDRSFADNELVSDKIAQALPVTISLNLVSIAIIYLVSLPVGIYAAVRRGQRFDRVSSVLVFAMYSMPLWWVATLLLLAFASSRGLDLFPLVGLHSTGSEDFTGLQYLADTAWHFVLPVCAYVYGGFAVVSRYVRTSMLEVIEQDFVRTARAKGLSEWSVVMGHAFRNALVVVVTLIGNLLPAMIGGSVVLEYIFSIQGMGLLGFNAILSRDYPVIMAITTLSAMLTLLGILLSDLLYGVVDPRVRVHR